MVTQLGKQERIRGIHFHIIKHHTANPKIRLRITQKCVIEGLYWCIDSDTFSKSGYQKLHTNLKHDTNIDKSHQLGNLKLFGEDGITKGDNLLEDIKF